MYYGRPPFSSSRTATLRKREVSATTPCIKGAEEHARFDRQSETKPAAATPYHYLPNERQGQKTSVSVAITRDGGDTGFQGSGSMATGNGVNSGSDNSEAQQSNNEGEQLPGPTTCNDTNGTSGVTLGSPDNLLADKANPLIDEANETEQSSKPSRTDEQLPEPTACEEGEVADFMSPDDLLALTSIPSDQKPHEGREREPLADPPSKQPSAFEAERHFLAPDQASPADIVPDSKEQEEVSCTGKVESAEEGEVMNEEKVETDEEEMVESVLEGKKQAESAGSTKAGNKDKTKEANSKTGASEAKRTSSAVLGQSKAVDAGATAQKQGTCAADVRLQVESEHEQLSTCFQESDSKKGSAKEASPPEPDEQADDDTADLSSGSGPCSMRVDATDVGEPPPVPHLQWVEDAQDLVTVKNEYAEVTIGGQLVDTLMIQMEPHDCTLPPPSHSPGTPHLPFPVQESEQGRGLPTQLALPDTGNTGRAVAFYKLY